MKPDTPESDIVHTLNELYRLFQDEYVANPNKGRVTMLSRSHIVCNGRKTKRIVTLPELYTKDDKDIQEIRVFVGLLPPSAHFHILHYPELHDVLVVEWEKIDYS